MAEAKLREGALGNCLIALGYGEQENGEPSVDAVAAAYVLADVLLRIRSFLR